MHVEYGAFDVPKEVQFVKTTDPNFWQTSAEFASKFLADLKQKPTM